MDVLFYYWSQGFVWDSSKAERNLAKHGIRFEQACPIFFDPFCILEDAGVDEEDRDAVIGATADRSMMFVIYVELEGNLIRIVSAREVEPAERRRYENSQ